MRVIVFGVGNYYRERKKEVDECLQGKVIAFADNNASLWGGSIENVCVIPPNTINEHPYDFIVIMSIYRKEIHEQLQALKVEEARIRTWEQIRSELLRGHIKIFQALPKGHGDRKNILFVSTELDYTGAPLAIVYAAMAAREKGYDVVIAARRGEERFIQESVGKGITVAIVPSLPYVYEEEIRWIKRFSMVLVNTFPMIECARSISRICPTMWWLHEVSSHYREEFIDDVEDGFQQINIYAVSSIARNNFNRAYPDRVKKILQYGIPDMAEKGLLQSRKDGGKIVFAVIGKICERKGQDIFIDAIEGIETDAMTEFWIIGDCDGTEFGKDIVKRAGRLSSVKLLGERTRREMRDLLQQIDVVVCTSQEETMSIAITEGMMFGKVCITTDNTGMAEYIENGRNGFVVPTGNVDALKERMEWAIINKSAHSEIGKRARRTYEDFFTMEKFSDALEASISETESIWVNEG